ncbi:MAG: zinc-binding dehydrogenase [Propionibacteriaceae bacterium]
MFAVYAASADADNPLAAVPVGDRPEPLVPDGWLRVRVKAASINHHDLWSLRGVGLAADRLPMILGCDAAGIDDDGNAVVVHAVIASPDWTGEETLDPRRTLLSELHQGTFADHVVVPRRNLLPKPPSLSFEQAACLPTAWLTAYKMLFGNAGVRPGDSILVQGAGGGVATAAIVLGRAAGLTVLATSRDERKRTSAIAAGAHEAYESGARLPHRVDAVIETVGAATWSHSVRCLRPGGTIVIAGATSGDAPAQAELTRIFFSQLRVVGSTMGSRAELAQLLAFCETAGFRPVIDRVLPMTAGADGLAAVAAGEVFGKVVLTR